MRFLPGLIFVSLTSLSAPLFAQAPHPAPVDAGTRAPATPPADSAPPAPEAAPLPQSSPATPNPEPPPPAEKRAAPTASPVTSNEPPPPPPRDNDTRPTRVRRPFYVGGELGWNGLSGLGVNFGYHPEPHFAIDTGAGLSLTGWRASFRLRANFLTGEWTPFLGAGMSFASGTGGQDVELESKGEKAKLRVLSSSFVQLAGGVNYTGTEGFVFTATTGYSILTRKNNTRFVSGSRDTYDDVKPLYDGGLIVSVMFGYAF